jgi:hypothetical protein
MVPELEQLAAGFVLVLNFLIYELDCKIFIDNLIASLNKWMIFCVLNETLLKILSPNSVVSSKTVGKKYHEYVMVFQNRGLEILYSQTRFISFDPIDITFVSRSRLY